MNVGGEVDSTRNIRDGPTRDVVEEVEGEVRSGGREEEEERM